MRDEILPTPEAWEGLPKVNFAQGPGVQNHPHDGFEASYTLQQSGVVSAFLRSNGFENSATLEPSFSEGSPARAIHVRGSVLMNQSRLDKCVEEPSTSKVVSR